VFPAQVIDGETLDVARDAAAERIAVFGLSYVSTETNGYPNLILQNKVSSKSQTQRQLQC